MAFCEPKDVATGNIPLPRGMGNEVAIKQTYINRAAEEIETKLGAVYTLPLTPKPGSYTERVLRHLNRYLATGQLIIDAASGGEDNSLHAYGFHHLREANNTLADIINGKLVLDLEQEEPDPSDTPEGPMVLNKESSSYVDSFYNHTLHRDNEPAKPVYPQTGRFF